MGNLVSVLTIPLIIFFLPWAIRRMPYFRRPDVRARRAAVARLPGWVRLAELLFFCLSEVTLVALVFSLEMKVHQALHQGRNILQAAPPRLSSDFVFWLIQVVAPIVIVIPMGLLLANSISWLIPAIRKEENVVMAEGVPGYTWHDANYGLIKIAIVVLPVCLLLIAISLIRI